MSIIYYSFFSLSGTLPTVASTVGALSSSSQLGISPVIQQLIPSTLQPLPYIKKENIHIVTPSSNSIDNFISTNDTGDTTQFTHQGQNIKITSYLADTNKVLYYGDRIGERVRDHEDSQEERLISEIQEHAKQRIFKDIHGELKLSTNPQLFSTVTMKPIVVAESATSDSLDSVDFSSTAPPILHVSSPSDNGHLANVVVSVSGGESGYNTVIQSTGSSSVFSTESTTVAPPSSPAIDAIPTPQPLIDSRFTAANVASSQFPVVDNGLLEKTEYQVQTENPVLITPRPNDIVEQLAPLQAGVSLLSAPEAGYLSQSSASDTQYQSQSVAPEIHYQNPTAVSVTGYQLQSESPGIAYSSQTVVPSHHPQKVSSVTVAPTTGYQLHSLVPEVDYPSPMAAAQTQFSPKPVREETNEDNVRYKTTVEIEKGILLDLPVQTDYSQNEVQPPQQYQGLAYEQRLVNTDAQKVIQEQNPIIRDQKQDELLLKQELELQQVQQNIQELQQQIINEIDAQHEHEQRQQEKVYEERSKHLENLQKVEELTREQNAVQISSSGGDNIPSEPQINVTPEIIYSAQQDELYQQVNNENNQIDDNSVQIVLQDTQHQANGVEGHVTEAVNNHIEVSVDANQHHSNQADVPQQHYFVSTIPPTAESWVGNYNNPNVQVENPVQPIVVYPTNQRTNEAHVVVENPGPTAPTYPVYHHTYEAKIIAENNHVEEIHELAPPPPPPLAPVEIENPVIVEKPTVIETTKVVEIERPIIVKETIPIEHTKVVEVEKHVPLIQPYPVEVTKLVHVDRPVAVPTPYAVPQPVAIPFAVPHAVGVPVPHLIPYPEIFPITLKEIHPIFIHNHYDPLKETMKPSIRVPNPIFKDPAKELYEQSHGYHTIPLHLKLEPKHHHHHHHHQPQKSHSNHYSEHPRSNHKHHSHSGRSKNVLKNLRIEYGFKPPLIPSAEIKEKPKPSIYGPSVRPEYS